MVLSLSGVLTIVARRLVPRLSAQVTTPTTLEADQEACDVLGAFDDSLKLLLIEHGIRIALQEKTRRELGGPFWLDYRRSVRDPAAMGRQRRLVGELHRPSDSRRGGRLHLARSRSGRAAPKSA